MQAIWRNEWVHEYETPWSIFEKLSFANRVSRDDIFKLSGNSIERNKINPKKGDRKIDLFSLRSFDESILEMIFGLNLVKFTQQSIQSLTKPLHSNRFPNTSWFSKHLRWCNQCISYGHHSWLHQFKLLEHCPFHKVKLEDNCARCKKNIPFVFSNRFFGNAFSCKCGFEFADFSSTLWENWDTKFKIVDSATLHWLSLSNTNQEDGRILILPEFGNLNILSVFHPYIAKKSFTKDNNKISIDDFYYSTQFNKELYYNNVDTFQTVDRHIRKNVLWKHSNCIKQFWQLLKNDGEDFPDICPYAYAYVNWRKTLLKTERFYRSDIRINDVARSGGRFGYELLTRAITDDIKLLLEEYVLKNNGEKINKDTLEWIQEHWTYRFSLMFFYECLKYSGDILVNDKKNTNWDKILMDTKANFKIAFKYQEVNVMSAKRINLMMYYENTIDTKIVEHHCPNHSLRKKRAISKMKSYVPARISIEYPKNYELINYVSSYIKKHDY
ncbi:MULTISPECIES: TniQ family protein [unclassified Paenibacillus]|uniref:TniQ family protein n=1 Tax=unclassified Paenibacillus TaxID=185978 RepID=UPI0024055F56|nr:MULTISPECIES: TniQ family protein [unclassified Paenibacillus]MDF9841235.1 hypothetical protein [Paenibacillus sp. PastF-2]MDF9847593.1 hypothetical protein [Paenibacillus sp. PastM-2]MDF9854162.1 hypothetical protein [Paenibacillus sp. PastF-1]MDH6479666.1 hypothetical protein [Paenibacillus sp. PastH-2]